jgi:hypothetical protein
VINIVIVEILTRLSALVEICAGVLPAAAESKGFGDLMIVCRDRDDDDEQTAEEVLDFILHENGKNVALDCHRRRLTAAFNSISVFFLPQPNVKRVLKSNPAASCSKDEFIEAAGQLRSAIFDTFERQRTVDGAVVTGPLLAGVLRELGENLTIPPGATEQIQRKNIENDLADAHRAIDAIIVEFTESGAQDADELKTITNARLDEVLSRTLTKWEPLPRTIVDDSKVALENNVKEAGKIILAANEASAKGTLTALSTSLTRKYTTTFLPKWTTAIQEVPFRSVNTADALNVDHDRFWGILEREFLMKVPRLAGLSATTEELGRLRRSLNSLKQGLQRRLNMVVERNLSCRLAAATTEKERETIMVISRRLSKQRKDNATDPATTEQLATTRLGTLFAVDTAGHYMRATKLKDAIVFLANIPRCTKADTAVPYTDDELLAEIVEDVKNHDGKWLPAHTNADGATFPEKRWRDTDFLGEQEVANDKLADVSYLTDLYPRTEWKDNIHEWPLDGYNNTRVLALVWNVIRINEHRVELTRILIHNIYKSMTTNGGGPWCGNGQGAYIVSSLYCFVTLGAYVGEEFSGEGFVDAVLRKIFRTKKERLRAANKYLDRTGIFGDERVSWISALDDFY